jgi:hypothetical protein
VSVALGFAAKARFDQAGGQCNGDRCTHEGVDARADAVTRANVATVVFGAGLGALLGGAALWLTSPHATATTATTSAVAIAPTLGGISVRGTF